MIKNMVSTYERFLKEMSEVDRIDFEKEYKELLLSELITARNKGMKAHVLRLEQTLYTEQKGSGE